MCLGFYGSCVSWFYYPPYHGSNKSSLSEGQPFLESQASSGRGRLLLGESGGTREVYL